MPTNWLTPVAGDLQVLMDKLVTGAANATLAAGGLGAGDRQTQALAMVVQRVRGVITAANVADVSTTPASVPPEGFQHTVVLAVFALTAAKPDLQGVIMGAGGAYAPFGTMVKAAEDWLKYVRDGGSVTVPTDPIVGLGLGRVAWGDLQGTSELNTAGGFDMTTDTSG